jgi:hypothetical protein
VLFSHEIYLAYSHPSILYISLHSPHLIC